MTAELPAELLDAIRSARACMADIRTLAGELGDLTQKQIEGTLLQGFLDVGEDRALAFGLRELAFKMLLEWERRANQEAFDPGHFEDLIEDVPQAGDLELARRIRDHCGEQAWWRPQAIAFRFDLLENPERFRPLERDCREAVCTARDEEIDLKSETCPRSVRRLPSSGNRAPAP